MARYNDDEERRRRQAEAKAAQAQAESAPKANASTAAAATKAAAPSNPLAAPAYMPKQEKTVITPTKLPKFAQIKQPEQEQEQPAAIPQQAPVNNIADISKPPKQLAPLTPEEQKRAGELSTAWQQEKAGTEEAYGKTKYEVVGTGEYKPELDEIDRAMREDEKRDIERGLLPGSRLSEQETWEEHKVDLYSFDSIEQFAYYVDTGATDEAKQGLIKDMAKLYNLKPEFLENAVQKVLGTENPLYDDEDYKQRKANYSIQRQFSTYGGLGRDGQELDFTTASYSDICNAIRREPNEQRRKAMISTLETATKTRGNRFYGYEFDKTELGTFLESANLNSKDYKTMSEEYAQAFSGMRGSEDEDKARYEEYLADLDSGNYTPYEQYYYKRALDQAFTDATGLAYGEYSKALDIYREMAHAEDIEAKAVGRVEDEMAGNKGKTPGFIQDFKDFFGIGQPQQQQQTDSGTNKISDLEEKEEEEKTSGSGAPTPVSAPEIVKPGLRGTIASAGGILPAGSVQKLEDVAPELVQQNSALPEQGQQTTGDSVRSSVEALREQVREETGWDPTRNMESYNRFVDKYVEENKPDYKTSDKKRTTGTAHVEDPLDLVDYIQQGNFDQLDEESQALAKKYWLDNEYNRALLWMPAEETLEFSDGASYSFGVARSNAAVMMLGDEAGKWLVEINNSNFPQECKKRAYGVLYQAFERFNNNQNRGHNYAPPEGGPYTTRTAFDNFLDENPRYREAMNAVLGYRDKLEADAQEAAKAAGIKSEEDKLEQIKAAAARLKSGSYTQEDIDLLEERRADYGIYAETYRYNDKSFSAQEEVVRNLYNESLDTDDIENNIFNQLAWQYMEADKYDISQINSEEVGRAYKTMLLTCADNLIVQQANLATDCGYDNLGSFYADTGLNESDLFFALVRNEFEMTCRNVSPLETALATKATYKGTGELNNLLVAYAGYGQGVDSYIAGQAESWFKFLTSKGVSANTEKVMARYMKDDVCGGLYAATQYKNDMRELANAGFFLGELNQFVLNYLDHAQNVWGLGIDPQANGWLRDLHEQRSLRAEAAGAFAQEYATPGQGKVFEVISNTGYNTTAQIVSRGLGLIASAAGGGPLAMLGTMMLAYGPGEYNEQFDKTLLERGSLTAANFMGTLASFATALANMDTDINFVGNMSELFGLKGFARDAVAKKGVKPLFNAGVGFLKGFVSHMFEEGIKDELGEGISKNVILANGEVLLDATNNLTQMITPSKLGLTMFKMAQAGLENADVVGTTKSVILNAPEVMMQTSLMAFGAGLVGAGNAHKSLRKMEQSGSGKHSKGAIEEGISELSNPERAAAFDEAVNNAQAGERAAQIMVNDQGPIGEKFDKAIAAKKQADDHQTELDKSKAAKEVALKTIAEKQALIDAGQATDADVRALKDATEALAKANQGIAEHEREAAEKRTEAKKLYEDAASDALKKAKDEIQSERENFMKRVGTKDQIYDRVRNYQQEISDQLDDAYDKLDAAIKNGDPKAIDEAEREVERLENQADTAKELERRLTGEESPAIDRTRMTAEQAVQLTPQQISGMSAPQLRNARAALRQVDAPTAAPIRQQINDALWSKSNDEVRERVQRDARVAEARDLKTKFSGIAAGLSKAQRKTLLAAAKRLGLIGEEGTLKDLNAALGTSLENRRNYTGDQQQATMSQDQVNEMINDMEAYKRATTPQSKTDAEVDQLTDKIAEAAERDDMAGVEELDKQLDEKLGPVDEEPEGKTTPVMPEQPEAQQQTPAERAAEKTVPTEQPEPETPAAEAPEGRTEPVIQAPEAEQPQTPAETVAGQQQPTEQPTTPETPAAEAPEGRTEPVMLEQEAEDDTEVEVEPENGKLRQYGNKTAQNSEYIFDEVKESLRGTRYEPTTNDEQIANAQKKYEAMGKEAAIKYLLGKSADSMTADDNVLLHVASVVASQEGDRTVQALLEAKMNRAGSAQGQALQVRKITTRHDAGKAMGETVVANDDYNRKKGLKPGEVPVGRGIIPEVVADNMPTTEQAAVSEQEMRTEGTNKMSPKMRQRKSDLMTKYGIKLVLDDTLDARGINGGYDSRTRTLRLNSKLGEGKQMRTIAMHELTHFLEGTRGYEKLKQAVFNALYDNDADAIAEAKKDVDRRYQKAGVKYDADHELVAEGVQQLLSDDENFFNDLIDDGHRGLVARLYAGVRQFLAGIKARRDGTYNQYRDLIAAQKAMRAALSEAGREHRKERSLQRDARNSNHPVSEQFSIKQLAEALGYKLERADGSDGMPYAIIDKKGNRVTSITKEQIDETPIGKLIQAAQRNNSIDGETADKQRQFFTDIANMALKYKDQAPVWEIASTELFSALKNNSDPQYNTTVDFGTVCAKTQAIVDVMSMAMKKLGRGLDRKEVIEAYNKTHNNGLSVPCPVCYVFSRWMGVPSLLNRIAQYQDQFCGTVDDENHADIEKVREYVRTMEARFAKTDKKSTTEQINDRKVKIEKELDKITQAMQTELDRETHGEEVRDDVLTDLNDKAVALEKEYSELDAYNWVTQALCKKRTQKNSQLELDPNFKRTPRDILFDLNATDKFATEYTKNWTYRTTRGAALGKAMLPYSGFQFGDMIKTRNKDAQKRYLVKSNPILTYNQKKLDNLIKSVKKRMAAQNLIGGQRWQSTSDFRPEWGLDYVMAMLEMQAVGANAQLYTKVIEAVDLFASAHMDVNLSIMGQGKGWEIDPKTGKPRLVFSDVTGIDHKKAFDKCGKYDSVQCILVGLNDDHIRLAMADDRITFIIPWHSSGSSEAILSDLMKAVQENLEEGTDYSNVQNDGVRDDITDAQKNLWDLRTRILTGELTSKKKNARRLQEGELELIRNTPFLNELYQRFYEDPSAPEYGVAMSAEQAKHIFPYEYWDKTSRIENADVNGQRFLQYCKMLGRTPRFEKFSKDPGYWKLLIDRRMYDTKGNYRDQQKINVGDVKVESIPSTVEAAKYAHANNGLYENTVKAADQTVEAINRTQNTLDEVRARLDSNAGVKGIVTSDQSSTEQFSIAEGPATREEQTDTTQYAVDDEQQQTKTVSDPAQKVLDKAQAVYNRAAHMSHMGGRSMTATSTDNRWGLPLNGLQEALIREYGLGKTKLAGANYHRATLKQRMLEAIVATPSNMRGDNLLTLTQQLEFMRQGYAVTTEADLNFIATMANEAVTAGLNEAGEATNYEAAVALGKMYDAQANTNPTSKLDKFNALRYANMLSGTATWSRNVAANVLVHPLEDASTGLAGLIDRAVSKSTGTRTTGLASRNAKSASRKRFAEEVARTWKDYFVNHTDTSHGRKYDIGTKGRTFQNGMLDMYENIVGFAMQIGDRPFFEACYTEEADTLRRLEVKIEDAETGEMRAMTDDEIHQEATMRALERCFQEDNWIVQALNRFGGSEGANFLLKTVIPFMTTPTNIARRMYQYSPFGLAHALVIDGLINGKLRNDGADFDQRKFVMGVGRGLTGTGLLAAGMLLAAAGIIKPGREDEEEKKRRNLLGVLNTPYSMYIDLFGQQHEISWALPTATGLVLGASLYQRLENKEDALSAAAGIANDMVDQLFDNTFLSTINDMFSGYGNTTDKFAKFSTGTLNSLVNQTLSPSFIRQFAKAMDPYVRDTNNDNPVWNVLNSTVIQNWPGLRQMLPIRTDVTGQQMRQSQYYNWGGEHANAALHFLDCFISPTATIGARNDETVLNLLDLSYRTGETAFLPGYALDKPKMNVTKTMAKNLKLGGEAITLNLTADEQRELNQRYADLLFNGARGARLMDSKRHYTHVDGLRELMSSRQWTRMTDEERTKAVSDLKSTVKDLVYSEFLRQLKEDGEL